MEKYIGNKSTLLPALESFVSTRLPDARSISDLFAGTTNVARYFAARGFHAEVSDVNRFSYVLAQTYLGLNSFPRFSKVRVPPPHTSTLEKMRSEFGKSFARFGRQYQPDMTEEEIWSSQSRAARVLAALQERSSANTQPGFISTYFTRSGSRSAYESIRGTRGQRNYFSKENGLVLDAALNQIRNWWRSGKLDRDEVFYLLTVVIEEVAITANVNGTFHDFNRERLWPNALQPFLLRMPLAAPLRVRTGISNDDAISASKYVRKHDVCYVDPPYNFRQYTSYYHLLNFIAAFPFLESVEDYLEKLSHVRGQNMTDDYSSPFCAKDEFLRNLDILFRQVDADHVVLSYYSGRNHWNHWADKHGSEDAGFVRIGKYFESSGLFSSVEIVPVLSIRTNYQSRVGERKRLVNEYLFFGSLSKRRRKFSNSAPPLSVNSQLGIADQFGYDRTSPYKSSEAIPRRRVA